MEILVWAMVYSFLAKPVVPLLWPRLFCHTDTCHSVCGGPAQSLNFLGQDFLGHGAVVLVSYAIFAAGKFAWKEWRTSDNG